MLIYQHVRATNDTNGNPRRLFVFYGVSEIGPEGYYVIRKVIDEGYAGTPPEVLRMDSLPALNVTPSEYRRIKKLAKEGGFLVSR